MHKLLILLTLIMLTISGWAQPYFCAQANLNGTVNIFVHDNSGLNSKYDVFWSTDPLFGSASSLSVMSGGATDFTIPVAAIDVNSARYYFKVAVTPPSGVVATYFFGMIYLDVTQPNLNDHDIVSLRWNSVSLLDPGTYMLQRFDNAVWNTIQTRLENAPPAYMNFADTVNYPHCDANNFVHYRVLFMSDNYAGCNSSSNIDTINAYEYLCLNPTVDSVSISMDPAHINWLGHPLIAWHSSGESDIASYQIQRYDGNAFPTIAVVGPDKNFFVDTTKSATGNNISGCIDVYTYAIVAVDSCGNKSAGTYQVAQNNLKLDIKSFDACGKKAQLAWNRYHNMPGGLGGYKIYKRDDNGNNQLLATLTPGDTSYLDEGNFVNSEYYHYKVVAFNQGGTVTSGSCESTMQYQGPNAPDSLYIEYASVVKDRDVELRFYLTPVKSATDVIVERADNASNHFDRILTYHLDYPFGVEKHFSIIDSNVNVDAMSYQYRLLYKDTCGNISRSTYYNIARTILLKAVTNDNQTNILSWNHYSGWLENVAGYSLFRSIDGVMNPAYELDIIPPSQSNYIDDSPELTGQYANSEVCYYLVALENAGNPVSENVVAQSNTVCVIKEPVFAVPNAFTPYSQRNYQFRPVINQNLLLKYNLLIYNKWGQQIFESNSPGYGWNGMYKGQLSPSDVYIYVISYTSDTGKEYTKRGTFLLLN